ncbi:MAG: FG-GAP repeat protein [Deltaproteobacteria bacterium]|nr:FG-GAP repeat protein [Deltaproteobacteria bacterium]
MKAPNTMSIFRTVLGTAGVATLAFAGCTPSTFVDLGEQAPVEAINRPDAFRRTGFGATLAAVEGRLNNGEPSTRLAVGGGTDTGTWLYNIWNSDAVGTFRISSSACETPADDCEVGSGTSITGFPRFGNEGTCIAIGAASANLVRIKCETTPTQAFTSTTGAGSALEFGTAVAAVPEASAEATRGAVLVGAPGASGERGSIYRVPFAGGMPQELNEVTDTAGVVQAEARLGQFITTAALPDAATLAASFPTFPGVVVLTPYLAAISAPGQNRVVLAAVGVDPLDANDIDAVVLGCIDGPDGFGRALTAGDIDGDGMPEVYMGFGESTPDHPGIVQVFDLADLTTLEAGCADTTTADDPGLAMVTCPTVDAVECTDGAFGSALALGDVDADGILDLIAGAPRLTVENKLAAGGVFALAGSASGVDMSRASFMQISNPGTDDRLGASVAALRTHYGIPGIMVRHEVAAGAPGANAAFVFLCSGLGEDSSVTGSRCLEQAPE